MSRYIWNPEDEHVHGGSDFDDLTDTASSGSFNTQDEDVRTIPLSLYLLFCAYCGVTVLRYDPILSCM